MKLRSLYMLSLAGLGCLAFLSGCAGTPSKPVDLMTGEEMKALIAGNTVEGTNEAGDHYQAYHQPDGEHIVLKFTEKNGKTTIVKGTMTTEAKAMCTTWDRNDWGRQCYQYEREGDKIVYRNVKNKYETGPVNVLNGNPYNL
jgi:hypothetical protein